MTTEQLSSDAVPINDAAPINPDELIRQFDDADEIFPRETILAARQAREQIIPRLIDVLCEATAAY